MMKRWQGFLFVFVKRPKGLISSLDGCQARPGER